MKLPLIVVAGPTACGKTDAAIQLAKKINGEIVSADSMQIYKFMNIGTAKPTFSEMQGITHYLIDEVYPDEEFSIALFQKIARKYIETIHRKGKIPILAGGTGFYINSVVYDNDFMKTEKNEKRREELYKLAEVKGNDFLHDILCEIDEESSKNIHKNNLKRVVRAIEYFEETGEKISLHNQKEKAKKEYFYDTKFYVLSRERESLYKRIEKRVDLMFENGLLEEVDDLLKKGYSKDLNSMQGIGYKEVIEYLEEKISLLECQELIKKNTRNLAKRQLTWFNHQNNGIWIDLEKDNNFLE